MSLVFSNQGGSVLAIGVNSSAPVLNVVDASSFPDLVAGQTFYVVLENSTRTIFEVCLATAINKGTNEITVTRGVGGTTATDFAAGAFAENRLTKTTLESLVQSLPESGVGSVVDNMIKLSQAEYDGLTPDANTLYLIPGTGGGGGGGLQSIQSFYGTDTWTKPTGLTYALVWIQAGGGGGGGCDGTITTEAAAGSGGGGGGFVAAWIEADDLGATETVTIADATNGGEADDGEDAGTCSFGTLVSATGGEGGKNGIASTGFAGDQGGNGGGVGGVSGGAVDAFTSTGGNGHPGWSQGATLSAGHGVAGNGGGSFLGSGVAGVVQAGNGSGVGLGGADYGGGGAGAVNVGALGSGDGEGTEGGPGIIVVWEYY